MPKNRGQKLLAMLPPGFALPYSRMMSNIPVQSAWLVELQEAAKPKEQTQPLVTPSSDFHVGAEALVSSMFT
jgi:hypothetical protein